MFRGFFENIDYDKISEKEFLESGKQTKPSSSIKRIAGCIAGNNNTTIQIIRIIEWIKQNLDYKNVGEIKFKRTASEILESGIYTGCSDFALLFETITREKGIPTIHIQTAKKKFVEDLQKSKDIEVRGHHFCECFVNNRWILVDPSRGSVLQNYDNNDFNLGQYYIFSKSTDIFETGISNVTDNNQMIKRLFSGFDLERFHPANSIEQEISR